MISRWDRAITVRRGAHPLHRYIVAATTMKTELK
jgi:hypothetical protein